MALIPKLQIVGPDGSRALSIPVQSNFTRLLSEVNGRISGANLVLAQRLPTNANNNQFIKWNGTQWVATNTPSANLSGYVTTSKFNMTIQDLASGFLQRTRPTNDQIDADMGTVPFPWAVDDIIRAIDQHAPSGGGGGGTPANLSAYATLANPVFTGDARSVTPGESDNDTSIATTAFVKRQSPYKLLSITQSAYNALGTKDGNTVYLIPE